MKYDDRGQLSILIISDLDHFKRKPNIGFDAELNGLHFDAISFLEVVKGKKILSQNWQNEDFGTMSNTQYFDFYNSY